jgi:hypothetical protein
MCFWGIIASPKIGILSKLVCLEVSTKSHIHKKFEIFWTNIASTMACPNFRNGPNNELRPLGVNHSKYSKFETQAKFTITIVDSMYMAEYLTKLKILGDHWRCLKPTYWLVNNNYKINFTKKPF